ncbi:hypothetical protein AX17_007447 [Amanita inopinata Kibby_2008]|nr:hypothetical protein AX17_007447 [Amanita inopinata Kibby_2008]
MATTQRRRALMQTKAVPKTVKRQPSSRRKATTADELAGTLAANLVISDDTGSRKGKQKASEQSQPKQSDERKRITSMRAVNAASQALSTLVQSGWKKSAEISQEKQSLLDMSSAIGSAESAAKHLCVLRTLSPNDLNVERAAISILGKLVSMDMYGAANSALKDMYPRLCAHLNVPSTSRSPEPISCIHIPIPPSSSLTGIDSTLLTITSTYLTYALTITSQVHSSNVANKGKNKDDNFIHLLADALNTTDIRIGCDGSPSNPQRATLLSWLPHFTSLPSKHIDSVLTRVYTSLTKLCTSRASEIPQHVLSKKGISPHEGQDATHRNLFLIRMYALQCLLHTTDGVVAPATIWDQAARFGSAYVKSVTTSRVASLSGPSDLDKREFEATGTILTAYSVFVDRVERIPDRERIMNEKSFVSFLEWWMTFARRAGDLQTLNRISSLMRSTLNSSNTSLHRETGDSSQVSDEISAKEAPVAGPTDTPAHPKEKHTRTNESLVLRSAHLCTIFAQVTTLINVIDDRREDFMHQARELIPLISKSESLQDLIIASYPPNSSDVPSVPVSDPVHRVGDKCDRSLEKLRKAALKVVETVSASGYSVQETRPVMIEILEGIVGLFERASRVRPSCSFYTRSLDTLFILARTTLVALDPRTHDAAYKYLNRAVELLGLGLETSTTLGSKELANYVRCLSGTFHNLAGLLYQTGRYGAAVGFLTDGCKLGKNALGMHFDAVKANETRDKDGKASAVDETELREAEGWRQLEEQLYRRWELLGVCYAKIGDRKKACTAFVESIVTFPYGASFGDRAQRLSLQALFDSSQPLKQLANIVDRVSYMRTCELLLEPAQISLSQPSTWTDARMPGPDVIGALVERQITGLEGSKWKSNVKPVLARLLQDAAKLYNADKMPVRRARVLLRRLEFMYQSGLNDDPLDTSSVVEMAEEIEYLVLREDLGQDTELASFCAQYRASAHLWRALHAHYRGVPDQNALVARHAEEASVVLKQLLVNLGRTEPRRSLSKGVGSPPQRNVEKKTPPRRGTQTARKVAAAAGGSRARIAKKVVVQEPVTPKPKTRAVVQVSPLIGASYNIGDLVFDEFDKFLKLLQTTGRILGLMALILPKVHVLDVTRKICERHVGIASDGYISASIDLAHEYVKLGKLRRASAVFNHALNSVRSGQVSDDVCSLFLLRYAEALAVLEDVVQSSNVYAEALVCSQRCIIEDKSMPTLQKIQLRVKRLERAAMAAHVFALIQHSRDDTVIALDGMLQSLRLWNRAVDTLARLNPTPVTKGPSSDADVFEVSSLKEALPTAEATQAKPLKNSHKPSLDSLEWRVSEGLLSTLFSLSQTYLLRGSAREAEYFAQQAHDLSESLNAPSLVSRSLAKKGEILLQLGKLEEAHECLAKASEILTDITGIDSADIYRLRGDHSQRTARPKDAQQMYVETTAMLEELDNAFKQFDGFALGPRKSAGLAPTDKPAKEMILPELLASVLRQQIWLLRDEGGDEYMALLEQFMSLPYSSRTKAEENALMAQLTLHNVYSRFRNDMFLSSLSESTIALPMGMTSKTKHIVTSTTQDLLNILDNAAKLFWANLLLIATSGSVSDVRNATISLALINAFQTSLGRPGKGGPHIAARLLDISAAVTLRREMLEAIQHKFIDHRTVDDLEWHLMSPEGKALPRPTPKPARSIFDSVQNSDDNDDNDLKERHLKSYWEYVQKRYQSQGYDAKSLSSRSLEILPTDWTVIHINVTTDKSTLFVSRQRGNAEFSPFIFCVPLKGRRDNGSGDDSEEHLTLEDALKELREIIRSSDECTRSASSISAEDNEGKMNWWKQRRDLDKRLKELVENIEFCWLGAFKTILNPAPDLPVDILTELRLKLERLFQQCLGLRDKRSKSRTNHKGSESTTSQAPSQLMLDQALVECFSTLSPKCRDEELEDLIYFVLDLYQFHGVPVAVAELDIVQLTIDLRAALEEHAARVRKFNQHQGASREAADGRDEHVFLVLGKDVQGIPWESIPVLRGRSVSRIPSIDFLLDRLEFVKRQHAGSPSGDTSDSHHPRGALVNPRKGFYILNPSGDLDRTQERFMGWVKDMEKIGWTGTVGRPPSEQQFLDALQRQDLVVYFGHGGGEQYVRTHKIRHLTRCAATMLWGCSSGALREMGDFDRTGTPNSYLVAGW